jgi:hypothetical protein
MSLRAHVPAVSRTHTRPVTPLRIALYDMPPLQSTIITRFIEDEPDVTVMELAGGPSGDLASTVGDRDVDLVIASMVDMGEVCMLLAREPEIRALVLDQDVQRGELYELVPQRRSVAELSSRVVLAIVRAARVSWQSQLRSTQPTPYLAPLEGG